MIIYETSVEDVKREISTYINDYVRMCRKLLMNESLLGGISCSKSVPDGASEMDDVGPAYPKTWMKGDGHDICTSGGFLQQRCFQ